MTSIRWISAAVCAAALAGCVSPEQFETPPVTLQTDRGPVLCQLYRLDQVTWDRAIDRPDSMDVETADQLCRNEGRRIIAAG